jgi:hypothetical protein
MRACAHKSVFSHTSVCRRHKRENLKFYLGPDNEYEFAWQSYEVDLGQGGGPVAFKKIAYTNKHASAVRVLWRVSRVRHAVSLMPSVSRVFCLSCLLSLVNDALKMAVLYCPASMHVGISCEAWGYA